MQDARLPGKTQHSQVRTMSSITHPQQDVRGGGVWTQWVKVNHSGIQNGGMDMSNAWVTPVVVGEL